MAGLRGAAVISAPSMYRCSAPQSSTVSTASSPIQHLVRLPRRYFPCVLCREGSFKSSRINSHPGAILGILTRRTDSRQSSSPSPLCTPSSHEDYAVVEEAVVEPQTSWLRNVGMVWTGSLVLGTARAVLAETIDFTPAPSEGTSTDYLLSFLFIAAFIGLSVLTIGVLYLGVSDFLENRQRKAMQDASGEEKSVDSTKDDVVRVGSSKGFGVRKVEKKSEKNK